MRKEKPELITKRVENVVTLYKKEPNIKEILLKAAGAGNDLCEYAIKGMDYYRLSLLNECMNADLDVNLIADTNLSYEQMNELLSAMKKGIDVSDYVDPMLTPMEMYGITVSKLTSVNTRKYFLDDFNDDQLYEIFTGIEQGLDVSTFAKVEISANDMQDMRLSLTQGGTLQTLQIF